ncbi:hypothetical protein [Methylorubrum sp. SL192]|uniref:hypothetical protein n=1 Tax=Methylorubrum sp. SL192 TaxID=2995167 RepID=UPI002275B67C|nr:hypothetical protein [Methylorubrum sp. SL192]MCY1644595.1 hypothetical protein [Methylorubrum sp. SL192]
MYNEHHDHFSDAPSHYEKARSIDGSEDSNGPIIFYDARRAGGGKTYDIVTAACQNAERGLKCLIVQPTTLLIDETFGELKSRFPSVTAHKFHSDDGYAGNVSARAMAYFNNADLGGVVVLITHKTLINLPFFYGKDRWSAYFDECPNAFESFEDRLPNNHSLVTDHIRIADAASAYSRLDVTKRSTLSMIAQNNGQDSVLKQVQDIAKMLLSPNYDTFVNIAKFQALKTKTNTDGVLSMFSILRPDFLLGFKSVTICAALFEDTFAYHHWSRLGVAWRKTQQLSRDDASNTHPYNPSVSIYYGYEARYSKYLRNGLGGDNTPIIAAAAKKLGNSVYVRVENNDVKLTSPMNKLKGDNLIPGISHGLNSYKDVHNAVVIIAANQSPEASRFLREYCAFDDDMQFNAFTNHSVYQAICRTSIRGNELAHDKIWIVASKDTADWLSGIFPGSRVESLGLIQPEKQKVGRKRTYKSDNERKNASKNRSRAELSLASGLTHNLTSSFLDGVNYLNGDELAIKDISHFVARFRASYFKNYFSTDPFVISKTESQFITYLRKHSKNMYKAKNEIPCVSSALFDVDKSDETNRGNDNVELVRGMWIDIEKGTMTHQDFAGQFPLLHMVVFNTFHHKKNRPRIRVYIPTNRVMRDIEYRMIHREIVYVLERNGYRSEKLSDNNCQDGLQGKYHGIDSIPHPCAVFTLPCQAQRRSDSFFKEYKGDLREPLDVDSWLQNRIAPNDDSIQPVPYRTDVGSDAPISLEQQSGIDASMSEWYRIGALPGEGHDAIFTLYRSLCALKLHPQIISERLYEAALSARSPIHRKKQVDRLVIGLRRWHQSRHCPIL